MPTVVEDERDSIRAWFFLLGTAGLILSAWSFFVLRPSPWLVVLVPLYTLGVMGGAGLLYVGIKFDALVSARALLPEFLLKVMFGMWLGRGIVNLLQDGIGWAGIGGITVHPGMVAFLYWQYRRVFRVTEGTIAYSSHNAED